MDKKSISGYFILVVGIVLVMILTFGTSQQTRSAYVVNADEPTTTEGSTATATDADDGDDGQAMAPHSVFHVCFLPCSVYDCLETHVPKVIISTNVQIGQF